MATIRPLAPELAEVARIELNESPSHIPELIQALRDKIEKQAYMKSRTDDQFLVAFLRFCKYNVEDAYKRIDYYYTYKTMQKDLLKSRQLDDKILRICKARIFATLSPPVRPDGPRIHLTRMGQIDTSQFSVQDIFRFHVFRSELEVNTDDNWIISGVLEIIDFTKIPYSLLRQFEPNLFKKMAAFLEYGVPTNLKGTHIVNASKEAQIILNLVRMVMKQKELLHIHSSLDSLHEVIPKEYLPIEYGGTNGTFEQAASKLEDQFLSFEQYFIDEEKYVVDERLRQLEKTYRNRVSVDGCDGSFRKLDID